MDIKLRNGLSSEREFRFPPLFAINKNLNGNWIQQLIQPGYRVMATVEAYNEHRVLGFTLTPESGEPILVIRNTARPPLGFSRILRLKKRKEEEEDLPADLSRATWVRHPDRMRRPLQPIDYGGRTEKVLASWRDALLYREESPDEGISGLRPPQTGGLHAVHAHWAVSDEPATVVMPTGTGKTETMLAVLVSRRCERLMVVVPTAALRTQIAGKFLTLGILKEIGVVSDEALYPIVGTLRRMPKTTTEVDAIFEKCHVIVTTMAIAGRCGLGPREREKLEAQESDNGSEPLGLKDESCWRENIQAQMSFHCPYLFIDEAHHVPARTWEKFKQRFTSSRVLQFTATPFRNDERPIGDQIIFNYPMRKAQEEGYFRPIRFLPVEEYDSSKADSVIAARAVEQLRKDLSDEFDHILMARVDSIDRASEVLSEYEMYPEFNPVEIHTGLSKSEQDSAKQKILNKESRIVVCVDMLGEGFDLPELKIAAFHDARKSLAVTLQLAGRFTRTKSNLGNPTFVANIAKVAVQEKLSRLYSQDADWNMLLERRSDEAIRSQIDLWTFLDGFKEIPKDIPLQNIRPPLRFVTFQTHCENWTPEKFRLGIQGPGTLEQIYDDVNDEGDTLIAVLARKVPLDWARIEGIYNLIWELYIITWDKSQRLLFVAGCHSGGLCTTLAKAVASSSFDVGERFTDDLKNKQMPEDLREEFIKQGIPLSPANLIQIEVQEGSEEQGPWKIHDTARERRYDTVLQRVSKEETVLRITVPVDRMKGEPMFRCFHGINLLALHNVGLSLPFARNIRYRMSAGANVRAALSENLRGSSFKSNIYGAGYENKERTAVGCSRKGKFWSPENVNLEQLNTRCRVIGKKFLDESISPDAVLEGTLKPEIVNHPPDRWPSTIEWPDLVYRKPEAAYELIFSEQLLIPIALDAGADLQPGSVSANLANLFAQEGLLLGKTATLESIGKRLWAIWDQENRQSYRIEKVGGGRYPYEVSYPQSRAWLYQAEIGLKEPARGGPLVFEVCSEQACTTFELNLLGGPTFVRRLGPEVKITWGGQEQRLERFFRDNPPTFRYIDGAFLTGNEFISRDRTFEPFPINKILTFWDWSGTKIRKESQGMEKDKKSIQYQVIQELKKGDFEVIYGEDGTPEKKGTGDFEIIYDDDDSGEAADVIAIQVDDVEERIKVKFYHCKFSKGDTSGRRISDLYEVCGQAQKSIRWIERREELFSHLLARDPRKQNGRAVSRLEVGTRNDLHKLEAMSKMRPIDLEIFIVQPGLSRSKASFDQLRLLSATESYLMETYQLPFVVIGAE